MFANLATILPYLALAGLALEATPVAAKHQGGVQRRAAHARHVKHVERNYHGLPRSSKVKRDAPQISTLPDGRKCKVRPSPAAPSLSEPSSTASAEQQQQQQDEGQKQQDQGQQQQGQDQQQQQDQSQQQQQEPQQSASAEAPPQASAAPPQTGTSSVGCATAGWKNTGSKLGIAWPNGDYWGEHDPQYITNYIGSKSSWYYTWSSFNVKSADQAGLEFVPMLWGKSKIDDGTWDQQVNNNFGGAAVANALFLNEPNHHEQASISPEDSVWIWIEKFLPLRNNKGIKLGGAAPTSAPDGVEWVKRFHEACVQQGHSDWDCSADFAPVHYYDVDVHNFQQYLENFHNQVGKPLWVTEYACQNFNGGAQCDDGAIWYMHSEMSVWMDKQDWIHRYAPFGVMQNMQNVNPNNALMSSNGYITPLGNSYAAGFD